MKNILAAALCIVNLFGYAQRELLIDNSEKSGLELALPPVFTIDTTGTFNGHFVVANNYLNIRLADDTLFYNNGLGYMDKFYNGGLSRDSLSQLTDTILYRTYLLELRDSEDNSVFDTIIQKFGFYWAKNMDAPDNSFIEPPVFALGNKGTRCVHYSPQNYWQQRHNIKVTLCDQIEVCDLGDNDYAWCSGKTYTKIFQDDFEDNLTGRVNLDYWVIGGSGPRGSRGAATDNGWATMKNVTVSNGTLKLRCAKEQGLAYDIDNPTFTQNPGKAYTDGVISTNFKVGYGKFEIRAKIPPISGVNPAYWIFGEEVEVDGFEFFEHQRPDYPKMTVLSNKNDASVECIPAYGTMYRIFETHGGTSSIWPDLPKMSDGKWRIYTLVYDPNYISWWIQEEETNRSWGMTYYNIFQTNAKEADPNANCSCVGCTIQRAENFPDHLSKGVNLILQNKASTTRPSNPTYWGPNYYGPAPGYNSIFEIDWVRIYALNDCGYNKTYSSGTFTSTNNTGMTNFITGDVITLGGQGSSSIEYKAIHNPAFQAPNVNASENPLFVRANTEVVLADGFSAQDESLFEATNAFRGNNYASATDCQTLSFYPQIYKMPNANSQALLPDKTTGTSKQFDVLVYPNPVADYLRIKTYQTINRIDLIDMFGKTIGTNTDGHELLNVSQLKPGLYLLKLYFNNSQRITKFIKQ